MMPNRIRPTAKNALFWSTVGKVFREMVRFIIGILLARLIAPSEFGIVAMVIVFISISDRIQEGGLKSAIINERRLGESDLITAFVMNVTLSVMMCSTLILSSGLIARLFEEPILERILPFLSMGLLIDSTVVVHSAILTKTMRFEEQAKAGFWAAVVAGVVGVSWALIQPNLWALVASSLSGKLTNAVILWSYAVWRPAGTPSKASFLKMTSFGGRIALSSLIESTSNNALPLLIGKSFGSLDLGLFNRASSLKEIPINNLYLITQPVIYSRLSAQNGSAKMMNFTYRRICHLMSYVTAPLMIFISANSMVITHALLGPAWLPSAVMLSYLSVYGLFHQMTRINNDVLMAGGHADVVLRHEIFRKGLFFFCLAISWSEGIRMVLFAIAIQSFVSLVVMTGATQRHLKIKASEQLRILFVYVCPAFCSVVPVTLLGDGIGPYSIFHLIWKCGLFVFLYVSVCRWFRLPAQRQVFLLLNLKQLKLLSKMPILLRTFRYLMIGPSR